MMVEKKGQCQNFKILSFVTKTLCKGYSKLENSEVFKIWLNKREILVLKNFKGQYKRIISSDYGILIRNVSEGVAAQRGVPQPLKTQRTLTVQGNSED